MTKCAFCKKEVVPPPTEAVIGSPDDPEIRALLRKVGRRCHVCGKVSCQVCAFKAAKQAGNNYFTCPQCGANIHENPLDAPRKKAEPAPKPEEKPDPKPEKPHVSWLQKLLGGNKDAAKQEKPKEKPRVPVRAPSRHSQQPTIPDDGRPALIMFLVDREPPWGQDTHIQGALQGMQPGFPPSRALLQVNHDYANPMTVGVVATMVARQHGFTADLNRLEYKSYQAADGVSGTMITIYRQ